VCVGGGLLLLLLLLLLLCSFCIVSVKANTKWVVCMGGDAAAAAWFGHLYGMS
jgi:Na+/H+ antiporter NhaD/arsenite permease-like protein